MLPRFRAFRQSRAAREHGYAKASQPGWVERWRHKRARHSLKKAAERVIKEIAEDMSFDLNAALKERMSFRRKGIRHSLDGQEAGGAASAGQADEGDSEDWDD